MRTIRIALVAALTLIFSLGLLAGTASAGDYPPQTPSSRVLDDSGGNKSTGGNQATAPQTKVLNSSSSLPVTGGDVLGLVVIGAAAIGLGAALTTYRRRASADS